ncbi:MAG: NAD(P)H-hydrate dehydratase [Bacteroidia bacterium]|nr:NAD(P)H-hydrate dehydratase [Bacteroidia bacterium]
MKILTVEQIKEIDFKTIAYENISSLEVMKRASRAFFDWFTAKFTDKNLSISIAAGTGNNGGDGLVVARMLHKSGYRVRVFIVEYSANYSEDCVHNIRRAKAENISIQKITSSNDIPDLSDCDIIIDAIFGTGLNREVTGISRKVIEKINESGKKIISIDVPSGLSMSSKINFAVQATETVSMQIPKLALYLPDNENFTRNVHLVDIGLSEKAIAEAETSFYFVTKQEIKNLLKPLKKFAHKGIQGHSLIIGGSIGKIGSVCLASKAALKTGCGLVTAFVPKCGTVALQSNLPEAMVIEDRNHTHITEIDFDIHPNAIGVGVGLSELPETQDAFYRFLKQNKAPLVIDADGLNILSKNKEWLDILPSKTILTPHPKELLRLIGEWSEDYDKIDKTIAFVKKYNLIVVLKGANSLIIDSENVYVNSTGTPALATAGSGDVLTGIITSLLAQGYESLQAAKIGVFLHGLTADISANRIHARSFIASDIIKNIGNAYFEIEK